jgi:hypothetical protein
MQLDKVIGQTFTINNDSTTEYICVGYAQNDTFVIFGAFNDITNNRYTIKSFKLADAKFKGLVK